MGERTGEAPDWFPRLYDRPGGVEAGIVPAGGAVPDRWADVQKDRIEVDVGLGPGRDKLAGRSHRDPRAAGTIRARGRADKATGPDMGASSTARISAPGLSSPSTPAMRAPAVYAVAGQTACAGRPRSIGVEGFNSVRARCRDRPMSM